MVHTRKIKGEQKNREGAQAKDRKKSTETFLYFFTIFSTFLFSCVLTWCDQICNLVPKVFLHSFPLQDQSHQNILLGEDKAERNKVCSGNEIDQNFFQRQIKGTEKSTFSPEEAKMLQILDIILVKLIYFFWALFMKSQMLFWDTSSSQRAMANQSEITDIFCVNEWTNLNE